MNEFFQQLLASYERQLRSTVEHLPGVSLNIVQAILVFFIALWIAGRLRALVRGILARNRVDRNVQNLLGRIVYLLTMLAGILTMLSIFGVDLAAFVALVGVFGLAASLAAQDILKNFFSGLYLLVERPFYIGDRVSVDKWAGTIEDVGFRTTRIRTEDNEVVYVPNATIFSSALVNQSQSYNHSRKKQVAQGDTSTAAAAVTAEGQQPEELPVIEPKRIED